MVCLVPGVWTAASKASNANRRESTLAAAAMASARLSEAGFVPAVFFFTPRLAARGRAGPAAVVPEEGASEEEGKVRDEAGVETRAPEVKERVPSDTVVDASAWKGTAVGSARTVELEACWLDVRNAAPLAARDAAHEDKEPPGGGKNNAPVLGFALALLAMFPVTLNIMRACAPRANQQLIKRTIN